MHRILCLTVISLLLATSGKAQTRASFAASPSKGCSPATIKFTDQSTGNGLTYFWDLGNGNTSNLKDPQAIYYASGFYSVKLKITDNTGKSDSIVFTNYIEIFKNPVADFSAKYFKGCTPFDPVLTDSSTRGSAMITQWTWDYNDGKVSNSQNPTHSYTKEGIYDISLVVKDANGCQSKTTKKQYITVNAAPQLLFSADKTISCTQPFTVKFTNKSIGLKSGDTFEWEFGDGTKSTDKDPKKTYTDTGSFNVKLSVTSANGCNTTIELKNYIIILGPKPSFTYYPSKVCEDGVVTFTNTSTPIGFNYITNWEFGDGNSGKGYKVTNKYKTRGKYSVKLTVSLSDGSCKESITIPNAVTVLPKPVASFKISDTIMCVPGLIDTLIDISVGGNMRYWYINDTFVSANKGVILRISNMGYTKITLISGNGSCFDTLERYNAIYTDSILPVFSMDPQRGCEPLTVTFTDLTKTMIPITSRIWDLGGGNFQNQESFDFTFLKAGVYPVKLRITTEPGCTATTVDTVRVGSKPQPYFTFPESTMCNSEYLEIYTAQNLNKLKIDEWKWLLDSSTISTEKYLKYKLSEDPGVYSISLIAGNNGCYDTIRLKDVLKILPPLVSYSVLSDSCKGYPYVFINTTDSADEIGWVLSNGSTILNRDTLVVTNKNSLPKKLWGKNFKSGCTDTIPTDISAVERLVGFTYSGNLCAPSTLSFDNFSLGYDYFKWNWGDGTKLSDNAVQVKKTFRSSGIYKVLLSVEASNGCKDTTSQTITVKGPTVKMEVSPKSGCGPLQITLINKTSDTTVKNKFWLISGLQPVAVTSDTMYFTLKKPGPFTGGAYAVSLSMEDPNGCKGLESDTVKVQGLDFHFEVMSLATCAYPRLTITPVFTGVNIDQKKLSYFWDVGDGRKFTGLQVNYWYKTGGAYNLNLKVIDQNACVTERDTLIENNQKTITADLLADKLEASCPPLTVNFISKAIGRFSSIETYLWDFGDGTYSNLPNPSHVYLIAGKFTVTLTVKDELGCTDKVVYKDLILIDGPVGSYTFDKKTGCTPLFVNFISKTSNTFSMEWDMGDGEIIKDTFQIGHSFTRVGKYIPLLVLADSFGCKYTLPPLDTIEVYPNPLASFKFTVPCIGQPVYFSNASQAVQGKIEKCLWDFGDGQTSDEPEPQHTFNSKGVFSVKLMVWNTEGCKGEFVRQIQIKNIEAAFKPGKDFYCNGQIPELLNISNSDTTIKSYHWFLNGALVSKDPKPKLPVLSSGVYSITLAIIDDFGCTDTIVKQNGLIIGDTLPPLPPIIYRVSVENDHSVVLDHSGYRSFDFKQYTIYTLKNSGEYSKLLSNNVKNDTSKLISSLNTLHNVYCLKVTAGNLCGYETDLQLAPAHCTVEAEATGGLKKVDIAWNSYFGWPVAKYDIFRENMGLKGKYDYLASVDGNTLTYIDTLVFCKINHFYRIKAFEKGGYNQVSWSDTTAARPLFDNAVPPNHTIRATVDLDKEITIEWTGSGTPRIPIKSYVLEKSTDGIHYKWYESFKPDEFSFTDKKVLVDDKSYFYRTFAIDTCEIRSAVTNYAKTILLYADTTPQERPFVSWSAYQGWNEGVSMYEVQRKKPDGSFVTIGNTGFNDSILVDNITDLNGYPFYCYRVIGYKNTSSGQKQIISISNEDCAPVRSRIFAANAFTLNRDGINETFDIKGLYIKEYNIKIFNRWGEKVFESNSMDQDWDGYYKGELSQMDAFIWIISAVGVDDVRWPMKGTVTVIR